MVIDVMFKTPDSVEMALNEIEDEDERAKMTRVIERFVKYGEIVTIRFDSDKETAQVV